MIRSMIVNVLIVWFRFRTEKDATRYFYLFYETTKRTKENVFKKHPVDIHICIDLFCLYKGECRVDN